MATRRRIDLNGKWSYVVDQYMARPDDRFRLDVDLESNTDAAPMDHSIDGDRTIPVPSCWNMAKRELHYFESAVWYYRRFRRPTVAKGRRVFLCFEGSYYRTRVWLNEKTVGEHLGGFTPFEFDVTDLLTRGENLLSVQVDALRLPERVPTTVTDCFTYGGLYGDVFLEVRPDRSVRDLYCTMDRRGRIVGSVSTSKPGEAVLRIPELGIRQTLTRIHSSMMSRPRSARTP